MSMGKSAGRQLCLGSDLLFPTDLVNEWTCCGSCPSCGQEVRVRLVEPSWFLDWHLEQLESGPDIEVPLPL